MARSYSGFRPCNKDLLVEWGRYEAIARDLQWTPIAVEDTLVLMAHEPPPARKLEVAFPVEPEEPF